jgi:hypothetical protein
MGSTDNISVIIVSYGEIQKIKLNLHHYDYPPSEKEHTGKQKKNLLLKFKKIFIH